MRTSLIVASAILTVAAPIAAAPADEAARGIGRYSSFFAQPAPKATQNPPVVRNQPAPAQSAKPAVVCGMTLLPAPPVDPKMKKPAPDAKRFPTRLIEPQICAR